MDKEHWLRNQQPWPWVSLCGGMKKVWPFRFPIYQPGGLIAGYVVAGPHLDSTCLIREPSASTRYTSIETRFVCITCRMSIAFWAPWFLARCVKHHESVHCEEKGEADCPVVDGRRMWRHCAACSSRETARGPGCSRTARKNATRRSVVVSRQRGIYKRGT